jgi:hypothetical protein
VVQLEATLRQSANLPGRGDNADRKVAVTLRRRIAEQIATVSEAGELVFNALERRSEFRTRISRMKTAMALHQASYPIVSIDRRDPDYRASVAVAALRAANGSFFDWVRTELRQTR